MFSSKDTPFKDECFDGDPLYSTISSSDGDQHKVVSSDILSPSSGEYHERVSSSVSHLSADDNCSNNSGNETKGEIEGAEHDDETYEPHTYSVAHFKERGKQREQENKVLQDAHEALSTPDSAQKHSYSSDDETPSIPPHTVEMMYTAVQKRPKDGVEIEDEGDAPPIPPYTGEEYHTSGTLL